MSCRRPPPILFFLLATALGLAPASGGHGQGMCHAPTPAMPCAGFPTSPPQEPSLSLAVGNPVDAASGRKYLHHVDMPAAIDGSAPGLGRVWNGDPAVSGPWGPGWQSDYAVRLLRHGRGWRVVQPDGQRLRFGPDGRAADPALGRIEPHGPGRRWRWPNGTLLSFDRQGRLRGLAGPGRPPLRIHRHAQGPLAGLIERIEQGKGIIRVGYGTGPAGPRLETMDSPAGRFLYRYDEGAGRGPRLVAVQRPDGMQRRYLYEPAAQAGHDHAPTGIELVDARGRASRLRSWSYDAAGRVVQATPGSPGQARGALRIRYPDQTGRDGVTEVQAAGGGRTELMHALRGGQPVLSRVRGDGCAGCPPPGLDARHDRHGRLVGLGGLRLARDPQGRIVRILPDAPGWPGLRIEPGRPGGIARWQSALSGTTRLGRDARGLLHSVEYANGDRLELAHDALGRPRSLTATRADGAREHTALDWQGGRLARLHHPQESEILRHDAQGRLLHRTVRRPSGSQALRYAESFTYDGQGRLVRHALPEGGALHYHWGHGRNLRRIEWLAPDTTLHTVIETIQGEAGYRHGNGLHLSTHRSADGRRAGLILRHGPRIHWMARRWQAASGAMVRSVDDVPAARYRAVRDHGHDARRRLVALNEQAFLQGARLRAQRQWLAWRDDGSLQAATQSGGDVGGGGGAASKAGPAAVSQVVASGAGGGGGAKEDSMDRYAGEEISPAISRDASGLPRQVGGLRLQYSPQRRLQVVMGPEGEQARYAHNGRGQQIRRTDPQGQTELYYLDNRVVGVWHRPLDAPQPPGAGMEPPTFRITQRFIYAHEVPVGLLQTDAGGAQQLFAIHADLLGAPRLVTDAERRIRWLADQHAGGHAGRVAGDLRLDLRLPGQLHDPATGWHDNIFRTYLPQAMQYLEPDPLGPVPGQQALGYAAQQPMRFVDPLGLILMAFDGTRNDAATLGNVWKLSQRYADGPVYYHAGPGNEAYLDWDAITAASADQILRNQWQSLLNALARQNGSRQPVPIDVLGYSRGAALARHLANQIAGQTRDGWFSIDDPLRGSIGLCVDLRFMGLFDSVAQFGLLGARNGGYELGITDAWQWVAHAVALHEFRLGFPLLSAEGHAGAHAVEAPFIGAHADIGGGMKLDGQGRPVPAGDLSDVALNWMLWQARAAGVMIDDLGPGERQVDQPLMHDERPAWQRALDGGDRAIQDSRGLEARMMQGSHAQLGDATRAEVDPFIRRLGDDEAAAARAVAEVDMAAYAQWLETRLGLPM